MNHAFEIIPLTVEARGEIITNNLPEFRELVREALANINRELKTDEDFEQAEKDVKALECAEKTVRAAALKAFDDKIKELVDGLNETAEDIRAPRLELEKLIAKRKDEVKVDLIRQAMERLVCAPRLRQSTYGKSVAEAVKGKRSFDSMSKALETIVTIHNGTIHRNRSMIESFTKTHGEELVPDREELETKSPDSVEAELRRRFEARKAAEERKRLEAEAAAARAAEAKARAEAEAAKKPPVDPRNPHNLPKPPKIGGIPTGANAAPPANVVPMHDEPEPQGQTASLTEDEEWAQVAATVKAAFALIKEHRERLIHARNHERLVRFGDGVNAAWKSCKVEEVKA